MKKYLLGDIGNTRKKWVIADESQKFETTEIDSNLEWFDSDFPWRKCGAHCMAVCDVRGIKPGIFDPEILSIDSETKLPFLSEYETMNTLGADRIALLAGGAALPPANKLIIDAGTCITVDLLNSNNVFKGGIISPGFQMRLDALHHFTGALPALNLSPKSTFPGIDTESCMQAAAINGSSLEINGYIEAFRKQFDDLIVLLCGGNASLLEEQLNLKIFAAPDLIWSGMYHILKFNGF